MRGAPNKQAASKAVMEPCLFPYTDMTIFSNGVCGICCNDATEKTCLGNVRNETLKYIWENKKAGKVTYALIREKICSGRNQWDFCRYCDTLDSGSRVRLVSKKG